MSMKIIRNSAQCMLCGDEIESTHRHDFVYCSCRNLFVDGGHEYLRRGYTTNDWRDTSIEEEIPVDHWENYGKPTGFICDCEIGQDHNEKGQKVDASTGEIL